MSVNQAQKIILALLIVLSVIAIFFGVKVRSTPEQNTQVDTFESYQATLSGEYVCLPQVVQSAVQTVECVYGIKTAGGEYYAVDTKLLLPLPPPLTIGQHFTGSGVITPIENLSSVRWQQYPIQGIFSITHDLVVENPVVESTGCTLEAKICSDGSAVGRSGPHCAFVACPNDTVVATSAVQVTTGLGTAASRLSVTIIPQDIVSDSRCPTGVTCVWAGTVEVTTSITTPVGQSEHVLTLGTPQVVDDYTITLVAVTPEKPLKVIPESEYQFTYEIKKKR